MTDEVEVEEEQAPEAEVEDQPAAGSTEIPEDTEIAEDTEADETEESEGL